MSVASLLLGILAIFPFSVFAGIPAIITGHLAVRQQRPGRGMADAGRALGWVSLALVFIWVILTIIGFPVSLGRKGDALLNSAAPA